MGNTDASQAARSLMVWLFIGAIVIMAALSLRSPLNHDEGQYVAAADLIAKGLLPYRDFPYLQTPLQPILFAPIAWFTFGWSLIAFRLIDTLCVANAILLIGQTASALVKDERAGVAAMLLALVTDSVLFAGSIARNDALPLLLLAGALERLYTAPGPLRPGRGFVVGLLSSAAASAKISYALPAAAICAQALWRAREPTDRRSMLALLLGSLVGALPTLYFALLAPRPFEFDVYSYSIVAVTAWAALKGQLWRLTIPVRIAEWTARMMQGPLLAMLVMGSVFRWRTSKPEALAQMPIALGPVVAAAALASLLPMPSLRQYLIPLAAPLIPWFIALAWPRLNPQVGRREILLLAVIAGAGVAGSVWILIQPNGDESPLRVEREAHLIGRIARQSGETSIATLEPVHVVDSGVALDPRIATGQFLFRAGNVPACADPTLCPITTVSIERLGERPSEAILTGTERKPRPTMAHGLDGLLDRWAANHGYRAVTIDGMNLLWLSPRTVPKSAIHRPAL